ncbi:MAG: BamA/TamA family outer membrane protein [Gemmatimonadota bacterium]|nr:BamA/TamA family outer membrane protein [Gemmatimonadota bacterium]
MSGLGPRAVLLGLLVPAPALAQSGAGPAVAPGARAGDTVTVAIGPQYPGSGFRHWLWGDHYRESWGTPIDIPVLDLDVLAGGLRLAEQVVGAETRSLVFLGDDGRTYVFRSIDKDPTLGFPGIVAASPAGDILRDQVSAEHPLGVLASQRFEQAVGLPAPEQRIFVMPDDPRLGDARDTFAGLVGMLAERPGGHATEAVAFGGFAEILDGNEIFDRIIGSHEDVIDSRAFLTARLVDMFTGDWDRHRLQWRWARRHGSTVWTPIPEDHDQAFLRLDGVIPGRAHMFVRELVSFGEEYPDIVGLHFLAREVDRRFLVDLDWPAWDSVTTATLAVLTDEVIDEAIARFPDAIQENDADFLRRSLRRRRDELPYASRRLYELLADDVELQFTNEPDVAHLRSFADGSLEVAVSAPGGEPYYRRVFDRGETSEVRLHLWEGDDLVIASGTPQMAITVRVVGGYGADELRFEDPLERVRFYDHRGGARIVNGRPYDTIDRTEYETWVYSADQPNKPVDWGTWIVPTGEFGISSDYGMYVGGGVTRYRYGFRQHPYASRIRLVGGISTQAKVKLEVAGDFRRVGSSRHTSFLTRFSTLEVVNFFGFGNDTERPADGQRRGVDRGEFVLEGALGRQFGPVDLTLGTAFELSNTQSEDNPFFSDTLTVYGSDWFQQVSLFANASMDTRDFAGVTTRGVRFDARLSYYPIIFAIEDRYLRLEAVGSTYLSARNLIFEPTLALRLGGARVWGDQIPFFNAALVGGSDNLRGFDAERFAGDASLFGSAELRLLVRRLRVALSADLGILGFVDAGRVWSDGESPGGFHLGAGVGIWAVVLGPQNTISGTIAFSEEGTRFYFRFGMPF